MTSSSTHGLMQFPCLYVSFMGYNLSMHLLEKRPSATFLGAHQAKSDHGPIAEFNRLPIFNDTSKATKSGTQDNWSTEQTLISRPEIYMAGSLQFEAYFEAMEKPKCSHIFVVMPKIL